MRCSARPSPYAPWRPPPRTRRSQRAAAITGVVVMEPPQAAGSGAPNVFVAQGWPWPRSWLAGEVVRARRSEVMLLQGRLADKATQATSEERNRIAREFHDVVAHQFSVVRSRPARPASPPSRAGTSPPIWSLSRRRPERPSPISGVPLACCGPGPGRGVAPASLEELDRLARRLRDAGIPLEMTTTGNLATVPLGVSVSSLRIVQEAFTNVVNHAGTAATASGWRAGRPAWRWRIATTPGGRGGRPSRSPGAVWSACSTDGGVPGRSGRRKVPAADSPWGPESPSTLAAVTIRVVIADDQALVRSGLAMILATDPEIEVVGQAHDGAGALAEVERLRPDVVLMDIGMQGADGLAAAAAVGIDSRRPRPVEW